MNHLLTTDCTITRVTQTGAVDVFNNPTESTTTASGKCHIQQRRAYDTTTGLSVATEEWVGYFPAGTVIDANDRVTVGTTVYEVYGPPASWTDAPTDSQHHIEANLRRAS